MTGEAAAAELQRSTDSGQGWMAGCWRRACWKCPGGSRWRDAAPPS